MYERTEDPLFDTGGSQATMTEESPAVTRVAAGAFGAPDGVTGADGALGALELDGAFEATTVNVYGVPFVSPLMTHGLAEALQVLPPGFEVTTYPVIGTPPVLVGATQLTCALALLATATTDVGEPGIATGVTGCDQSEKQETPLTPQLEPTPL